MRTDPLGLLVPDGLNVGLIMTRSWLDTAVHLGSAFLKAFTGRSKELIRVVSGGLCDYLLVCSWPWSRVLVLDVLSEMGKVLDVGLVDNTLKMTADALRCETGRCLLSARVHMFCI